MPTTAATAGPAPQLAIAARIVPRDDGSLQIGIRPDTCVRVTDTDDYRRALEDIARGARPPAPTEDLVSALRVAGLFSTPRPPGPFPVRVIGSFDDRIGAALASAGLVERRRAPLAVVGSVGDLDRQVLDPLVRAEVPHLIVRALDGVIVLGPFVSPGATACLRCIDEHHRDEDPGYPVTLERYVAAGTQPREDGCHDNAEAADATLACAWAARELHTFSTGGTPTTWSSTIVIGPSQSRIRAVSWQPHPRCGCRWYETAH